MVLLPPFFFLLNSLHNIDKYLEQKKLWNMKVIVIPIIVGAIGMVPKGLKKKRLNKQEIRGRIETCHHSDNNNYQEHLDHSS